MTEVGLDRIEYVLGETELDVDALPNKAAVLAAHGMPDAAAVWGWGRCRRSARSSLDLALDTARRTLAGVAPADVDAVVVCCGDRLNYFEQNRYLGAFAQALGLGTFQSHWLGGSGCVTLFAAVRLARALVAGGDARNVLVVSVDKVAADDDRFQRFGVLSDAACSFLVCAAAHAAYRLVDTVVLSAAATLERGDDFQAKCSLIHAALARFGGAAGYDYGRVDVFFGPNVFLPIQELELSLLPIDGTLAWQDNTERCGHCYAADPIVNLVDYFRDPAHATARHALLASTAHGHFGVMALERV